VALAAISAIWHLAVSGGAVMALSRQVIHHALLEEVEGEVLFKFMALMS